MQLPLINNIKRPIPVIAGVVAATIGLAALGTIAFTQFKPAPKIDLNRYTTAAKAADLTERITASGNVIPFQTANISPKTAGRVSQLFVEQGDRVVQGQKIAQMENAEAQAAFAQAQANVQQAQANLSKAKNGSRPEEIAQAKARLEQAQANLNKAKNGNRPEETAQVRAKLAQAQANLNLSRSIAPQQIEQATAQVSSATARLKLAQAQVDRNRSLRQSGAVSQDALDRATADYQTARANLLDAQQKLQQVRNSSASEINQRQAAVTEVQQALRQSQLGSRTEDVASLAAQVDQAQAAYEQAKNGSRPEDIAQLTAALAVANAQLQSARSQLNDSTVVAPFAGLITQRYASVGAFVTPTTSASTSTSATSTSIVALAKDMEVKAKVPEVDIGKIKVGQKVEITADAYSDKPFQGTVRLVAPEAVVEQNVTSFEVRVALDTGKDVLRSGMNVNTIFSGRRTNNALTVPTVAIGSRKGKTGVYIPGENNEPKFKEVKVGTTVRDKIQVTDGLKSGDRVFIDVPPGFKDKMLGDGGK
ncbi:efflux RND transporter periplasmic adaptor subunit [Chamaesiphon minutus]|uniref:RND family efflux transporter, MFP subunit n=1 Tax=Chamaesiphon minutus (strain ATCC 27169 / PCC 6605) TaxID=1173020 RepID=K9U8N9_CHAP6|nr:efflux RND transporter periplasmic adaptor subunit [Chamaesiphon minutus]AFY91447.1 RND family efflux transporter, MFP subunit [Chamaesiphon minutus PCC 6605]